MKTYGETWEWLQEEDQMWSEGEKDEEGNIERDRQLTLSAI